MLTERGVPIQAVEARPLSAAVNSQRKCAESGPGSVALLLSCWSHDAAQPLAAAQEALERTRLAEKLALSASPPSAYAPSGFAAGGFGSGGRSVASVAPSPPAANEWRTVEAKTKRCAPRRPAATLRVARRSPARYEPVLIQSSATARVHHPQENERASSGRVRVGRAHSRGDVRRQVKSFRRLLVVAPLPPPPCSNAAAAGPDFF